MRSQLYPIVRLLELYLIQYIICSVWSVKITSGHYYQSFLIHHLVATQLVLHTVILRVSLATRRSFQHSRQLPTVAVANLWFNKQLATANARWHLPSPALVDCIVNSSTVCWHKRLLRGRDRGIGRSPWRQRLLIIEVVTVTLAGQFGTNIY